MMKAIVCDGCGGPEVLRIGERTMPKASKPDEVLLRVEYTALNRADLMQRQGNYPPPSGITDVLGLECAGYIVEDDGSSTDGRRVMALLPGGGYAQFVVAHRDHVIPIPSDVSFEQAAAITEVWATAYQILHLVAHVKAGETVLIHAGSSGVGLALIQLSKYADLRVITTAGSPEKLDMCKEVGSDCCINYKIEDFEKRVKEYTGNKGVDVIADPVGSSYAAKNMGSIAVDGRWILYGLMGGSEVPAFSLRTMLMKRIQLLPTTLRSRSDAYKSDLLKKMTSLVLPNIQKGSFHSQTDKIFPMSKVADAHRYMGENRNIGKILLKNDL